MALVSKHQVEVYRIVSKSSQWLTTQEIAAAAGVAERTARLHAKGLADLGCIARERVFPGYRYRRGEGPGLAKKTEAIERAMAVLG